MSDLDEFKEIFFVESGELLADMEERLMGLEEGAVDADSLNAIFRCAHSIKGGAGVFGFSEVTSFTHTLEALLDRMRCGELEVTREAIDLLLKSADVVTQMLAIERDGGDVPREFGQEMVEALHAFMSGEALPAPKVAAEAVVANEVDAVITNDEASPSEGGAQYRISFSPKAELFATGNDPLNILRELSSLGIIEVTVDTEQVPYLSELDPANSYMKWEILLSGQAGEEGIFEVFEFVEDVAEIKIETLQPLAAVSAAEMAAPPVPSVATVAAEKPVEQVPAEQKPVMTAEAQVAAPKKPTAAPAISSIRVDLSKIDRLVNMVGELVITEAMLCAKVGKMAMDGQDVEEIQEGLDELSHHARELQEAVMAVRMQPVKSIFSRMPRLVRDTAAKLGKDIQLVTSGETTEVDKTVIEQLGDPLTHMIRNSVDHGIELPEKRLDNNKPAQGTIHLSAAHRSGRIMIEISDDGGGINREKVLAKAIEKGLVEEGAKITNEQIDQLIFAPGFSTADQVSDVSGRGVGMDVVRKNIESIGGNVHVDNSPGIGATMSISLPLTLAILDGMIVRVGAENYIVPIVSIVESLKPKKDDIHYVEGRGDVINVRGEFIPLVYLYQVFNIENAVHKPEDSLIVLVECGRQRLGVVVDDLLGQQQVVIKSLEANAGSVRGISGATILGDGRVSLILDVDRIWNVYQDHQKTTKSRNHETQNEQLITA